MANLVFVNVITYSIVSVVTDNVNVVVGCGGSVNTVTEKYNFRYLNAT